MATRTFSHHRRVVTDEEIEYVRGDGTLVFLSVSSAPVLDREGRIIAAVLLFLILLIAKELKRFCAPRKSWLLVESRTCFW